MWNCVWLLSLPMQLAESQTMKDVELEKSVLIAIIWEFSTKTRVRPVHVSRSCKEVRVGVKTLRKHIKIEIPLLHLKPTLYHISIRKYNFLQTFYNFRVS